MSKMENKVRQFLKNSGYAISSNLLTLIVSSLVVVVLPRIIGVSEYGYWQLYLFYTSYVGFAHLGWLDGIYLRYGGEHYHQLDKKRFSSQFIIFTAFQSLIALCFLLGIWFINTSVDKAYILSLTSLTLIITNVRFFLVYLLQMTNRIKESSRIIILDRLCYVILLSIFILKGVSDYNIIIFVDIIARLLSLVYAMFVCRDVITTRFSLSYFDGLEIIENIKAGSSLMLSNVASMLIIGIVRLGIEREWDVTTFGKISLTLSISNLIMVFINAVGLVVFPFLKRTSKEKLPALYREIRNVLMVVLLGIMLLYFPLQMFLAVWLPKYSDSLVYMALVFPISVSEGKMALLINTYFKAYRLEKSLLRVNLISMLLSVLFTYVTTVIYGNLILATLSITVLLFIRGLLAELFLGRILRISILFDICVEFMMVFSFILLAWHFSGAYAFIAYLILYFVYLYLKKRRLTALYSGLRKRK